MPKLIKNTSIGKKRLILILLVLSCITGFYNCNNEIAVPIRVGTNLWIGYEPLYIAKSKAFFTEDEVALIELPSASDVIKAFKSGLLDAAALTLDESFLLLQEGYDVKILLVLDISNGGDVLISKPEISSIEELKGKKVVVENTAVGAYLLTRALESVNMEYSDIEIVSNIVSGHEDAYDNKDVSAVVTFEPIKTKLLNKGGVSLFDSQQIPNEIFDILVVRSSFYNDNAENIDKLKKAWYKSLSYIKNKPDSAYKIIAQRMQLSDLEVKKSLEGIKLPDEASNKKLLQDEIIGPAKKIRDIMLDKKLLEKSVEPEKMLNIY